MSKSRNVYVGIEGSVYAVPEKVGEFLVKTGADVKVSPPIDVLKRVFKPATIRSIKQMTAGQSVRTMDSDEDIKAFMDEIFGSHN